MGQNEKSIDSGIYLKQPFKVAIATVATVSFLPGTQALLSSILAHNTGLDYDFIVIGDESPELNQNSFSKFPEVKFHPVGATLQKATRIVGEQNKLLRNKLAQFYSLEAFNLTGYDKVLFLDSDIICRQSLRPLLAFEAELCAAYDRAWLMGKHRLYNSFYMVAPEAAQNERTLHPSYNSGVLLIDKSIITTDVYEGLIKQIDTIDWRDSSGVNDQIVINQYFEDRIKALPETYNYITERVGFSQELLEDSVDEVCFVHFIGQPKPWNFKRIIKGLLKGRKAPKHWQLWLKAYWGYLMISGSGR